MRKLLAAPVIAVPIVDQSTAEEAAFSFVVPAETFTDEDPGDTLTYAASLADDAALPAWLSFDAATQTFSGTPDDPQVGALDLKVTATDSTSNAVSGTFTLTVTPVNDAPVGADDTAEATNEDTAATITTASLLANDTDVDTAAEGLSVISVANPAGGEAVLNGDNTITFTPAQDFNGAGGFDYILSDGDKTDTVHVSITVNAVNDAPVAIDDKAAATEDVALTLAKADIAGNDTDVETASDQLVITEVSNATGGEVVLNEDGTVTFTPAAEFSGAAGFDYVISDGELTDTGHVVIDVAAVNDAPVATDDTASTDEEVAVTITAADLLANDTDVDTAAEGLSISGVANAVGGEAVLNGDGTITFTPAVDFAGAATFDYTLTDGEGSDVGTVTVTVANINDAPVAADDTKPATEDTALNLVQADLLGNDTDVDTPAEQLSITEVSNAVGGSVVLNQDGSITFTPDADFFGLGSFDYVVSDGELTDTGSVSVEVAAVNDAPVATDDLASTDEDAAVTIPLAFLLGNDNDVDNIADQLSITGVGNAIGGVAVLSEDGTSVIFTPAANNDIAGTFEYTLSDGELTDTGVVIVTITPANDAPDVATPIDAQTAPENAPFTFTVPAGTFVDPDTNDVLALSATLEDGSPLPQWLAFDAATGTFSGTPDLADVGVYSVKVTATDLAAASADAIFSLTVTEVNDLPVANPDTFATDEEVAVTIPLADLLANDTDEETPAGLSITAIGNAAGGTAVMSEDGTAVIFTPAANNDTVGTFEYTLSDGTDTSTGLVTINITGSNDAPVVGTPIADQTAPEDAPFTFAIPAGTFVDPDTNDTLTLAATLEDGSILPDWLSFDAATGTFSATPTLAQVGTYSIKVTATDLAGMPVSDVFTLEVTAVNDAPIAGDDTFQGTEDTAITLTPGQVLGNDEDEETPAGLSITGVSNAVGGTVVLNEDASITFTPDANLYGVAVASFDYTITDGELTDTGHVTIDLAGVNDAPVATDDTVDGTEDEALTIAPATLLGNDTDIDTAAEQLQITGVSNATGGAVVLNEDGSITFTPDANVATAGFDYTLSDGELTDTGHVTINLAAVNDAPVAADDTATTDEDTPVTITPASLLANDTDVDNTAEQLSVSGISNVTGGTAVVNEDGTITFTPDANASGTGGFDYTVTDGALNDTGHVAITIAAVNDVPTVANPLSDASVDEGSAFTYVVPADAFADLDQGDTLTYSATLEDGSALPAWLTFDAATRTFSGTPNDAAVGTINIRVTATDSASTSASDVFTLTVNNVNDAPVAVNDEFTMVSGQTLTGNVLTNDTDADGDTLAAARIEGPFNGALTLNADGSFAYEPNAGFVGTDVFYYRATDATSSSGAGRVSINVTAAPAPENHAPTAQNIKVFRTPGSVARINALATANDPDGDPLGIVISTAPKFGRAIVNTNNTPMNLSDDFIEYQVNQEYIGSDAFKYRVVDGRGGTSAEATVTVTTKGSVALATSPFNRNKKDLIILGTNGNDRIIVTKVATGVKVVYNGKNLGVFKPTGRVVVLGMAGNDVLTSSGLGQKAWFHGGVGRDSLIGTDDKDALFA